MFYLRLLAGAGWRIEVSKRDVVYNEMYAEVFYYIEWG